MYKNAIVRIPCRNIKDGITTADLGKPDYLLALEQHLKYIETLQLLGLKVKILDKNDKYPDSTFIEDVALCTPPCAVITNPGAEARRGEIDGIKDVLEKFYNKIEEIRSPGTLEGGDVMKAGENYFIGISGRTNIEGAQQLMRIMKKYGMRGRPIHLKNLLHLKSGVSYLEDNNILILDELFNDKEFSKFNRILVDHDELYAANSLWINGIVLLPKGYPKTREKVEKTGYKTLELDVSEFRKVDGGISCLALRF